MKFSDFLIDPKGDEEVFEREDLKDLWEQDLMPREKLLRHGVKTLRDEELLAVLLGTGTKRHSVFELANMLYDINNRNIRSLIRMTEKDLSRIRGIGPAKLSVLLASFELSNRAYKEEIRSDIERFTTSSGVANYLISELSHYKEEHFFVLILNNKNERIENLIKRDKALLKMSSEEVYHEFFKTDTVYGYLSEDHISKGTINQTIAMPREVFRKAIELNASSIILAHNHPSGDVTPSREDLNLTRRMVEAGDILGIRVLDHFVIGNNNYYSFKENGDL